MTALLSRGIQLPDFVLKLPLVGDWLRDWLARITANPDELMIEIRALPRPFVRRVRRLRRRRRPQRREARDRAAEPVFHVPRRPHARGADLAGAAPVPRQPRRALPGRDRRHREGGGLRPGARRARAGHARRRRLLVRGPRGAGVPRGADLPGRADPVRRAVHVGRREPLAAAERRDLCGARPVHLGRHGGQLDRQHRAAAGDQRRDPDPVPAGDVRRARRARRRSGSSACSSAR